MYGSADILRLMKIRDTLNKERPDFEAHQPEPFFPLSKNLARQTNLPPPRIQDVIYDIYSANHTHLLWTAHVQLALATIFPSPPPELFTHFVNTHPQYLQVHRKILVFSPNIQSICPLGRKCTDLKCPKIHGSSRRRRSFEASLFRIPRISVLFWPDDLLHCENCAPICCKRKGISLRVCGPYVRASRMECTVATVPTYARNEHSTKASCPSLSMNRTRNFQSATSPISFTHGVQSSTI